MAGAPGLKSANFQENLCCFEMAVHHFDNYIIIILFDAESLEKHSETNKKIMREKAVRLWVLLCPGIVKNLVKDKNLKDFYFWCSSYEEIVGY